MLAPRFVGSREKPSRTLFRLSREKGLFSFRAFATRSRWSGTSLEPAACALRGISPLVQPLPFATCRRRPVRERILACLRHFFEETVSSLLWTGAARSNNDVQMYGFIIAIALWQRENAAGNRRGDPKYRSTYRVKANRSYHRKHAWYVSRVFS